MESTNLSNGLAEPASRPNYATAKTNRPAKAAPTNERATETTSNKPAQVIRDGAIAASIWLRQSPSGFAYYDFTLSRSWKSMKSGKTGYADSYFADNKQALLNVIEKVVVWIQEHSNELAQQPE